MSRVITPLGLIRRASCHTLDVIILDAKDTGDIVKKLKQRAKILWELQGKFRSTTEGKRFQVEIPLHKGDDEKQRRASLMDGVPHELAACLRPGIFPGPLQASCLVATPLHIGLTS